MSNSLLLPFFAACERGCLNTGYLEDYKTLGKEHKSSISFLLVPAFDSLGDKK